MLLMFNLMYLFVLLLIVKPYILLKKDKFNSVITVNIVAVFNLKD